MLLGTCVLQYKKTQCAYQINRRAFCSIRKIGGGYQSLRKFLCLMNHPPPMTEKNYRKTTKVFCDKIKGVAETLTQEASVELHGTTPPDQIVDVGITIDGTWQKRGFTSMNGSVAAISIDTGRIIDVEVMSRYCHGCVNLRGIKCRESDLYKSLKKHKCTINHEGSAPKMELDGVIKFFERSTSKHNLRYANYYGDGDTKSYGAVKDIWHNCRKKRMHWTCPKACWKSSQKIKKICERPWKIWFK